MTAAEFARICTQADARHREDPGMARYLDERAAMARRLLGLLPKETKS